MSFLRVSHSELFGPRRNQVILSIKLVQIPVKTNRDANVSEVQWYEDLQ